MYQVFTNFSISLLTINSFLLTGYNEPQVKLVQVLFRHGDRTPSTYERYPNDPYNSLIQSLEPGQLINLGKMREYKIGEVLRSRYDDYLGSSYQANEVYAYSADGDRTKMSLELVLAALYLPIDSQVWNQDLPWMPIPIHYVPAEIDILTSSELCPKYKEALKKVRELPEYHLKLQSYANFTKYLSQMTNSTITTLTQMFHLYSLLVIEQSMNLTLPDWCTDKVFHKLTDAVALEIKVRSFTTELKRLNGGPLVRRFVENMNVKQDRVDPRKIYLYSAHGLNVEGFLRALGITEYKIPFYGSTVIMEKLEDKQNNLFVRLLLWTGVTEKFVTLRIPGCMKICPMDIFLKIVQDVIPSDDEIKCHWNRLSYESVQNLINKI